MSQHTPTPWRIDGSQTAPAAVGGGTEVTFYIVGGKDAAYPTMFVSSTCWSKKDAERLESSVHLILSAVNAHDELLAAVEEADRWFTLNAANRNLPRHGETLTRVRAAIAKAKGEGK